MNRHFWYKKGPAILTFLGCVGTLTTSVMTAVATAKAIKMRGEMRREDERKLTGRDVVRIAGVYLPAVSIGAATVSCIVGANILNRRSQAALASAYALVDQSFRQYREKLKELCGDDELHNRIMEEIAIENADESVVLYANGLCSQYCLTTGDYCGTPRLFYDAYGDRYFEATSEHVISAEYHLNRNYALRGNAMLNELYEFLGLNRTEYGDQVGWCIDDYSEIFWIDFDHRETTLKDGRKCVIIEAVIDPSTDWQEIL